MTGGGPWRVGAAWRLCPPSTAGSMADELMARVVVVEGRKEESFRGAGWRTVGERYVPWVHAAPSGRRARPPLSCGVHRLSVRSAAGASGCPPPHAARGTAPVPAPPRLLRHYVLGRSALCPAQAAGRGGRQALSHGAAARDTGAPSREPSRERSDGSPGRGAKHVTHGV